MRGHSGCLCLNNTYLGCNIYKNVIRHLALVYTGHEMKFFFFRQLFYSTICCYWDKVVQTPFDMYAIYFFFNYHNPSKTLSGPL